ncbi:MAG: CPBP family intramembrane metalloprotease [Clostridia bacterium]|nr:CPBP family intramembrane metalloprotease [Clostridia bacterium]
MKVKGIHAAPALVLVVAAMMCCADFLDISKISGDASPYLTISILQLICIGVPTVFFCILRGNEYRSQLGLRLMRVKHITLSVYALLFIVSGTMALSLLMYSAFPEAFAMSGMDSKNGEIAALGVGDSIYAALTFAILPAILEELLFRGVVRAEYSKYGAAASVILSSVLFALLHFSPVRFPLYFFTGIILAMTASAANTIIPTVVIHVANNLFVLYFEKYIYKIAGKHSGGLTLLVFMVVSVMLISAILFFGKVERLYREYAANNRPSPLVKKVTIADSPLIVQAILSPTLLLLIVFWVVASFLL